jgi:hypothetical protein
MYLPSSRQLAETAGPPRAGVKAFRSGAAAVTSSDANSRHAARQIARRAKKSLRSPPRPVGIQGVHSEFHGQFRSVKEFDFAEPVIELTMRKK